MTINTLIKILPIRLRNYLIKECFYDLKEVRFRINQPIMLYKNNEEVVLDKGFSNILGDINCQKKDLDEIISYISKSSLYAFEEEIKNGFITVEGGHRVGITGKTVIEKGEIKTITNFTSVNIRVCHPIVGCSNGLLHYLREESGIYNTLILSPPRCGKTTLLRDIIKNISDGFSGFKGLNVGLVDERSEVASCYLGYPQNNVGKRTDILDCCNKIDGMMMLIRAMSPDVIALDEIGKQEEINHIRYGINCGCSMICTIHCRDIEELRLKREFSQLLDDKLFKRLIVLETNRLTGHIAHVYDEEFKLIKGNILLN